MIKKIENHPVLLIISVAAFMLFFHLDLLNVSIMEARNFISAREMIQDGNWLLPTMNGLPRYQKPPLPTWITAFFGAIFGIKSLFALRLPAMIMVLFLGISTYFLSKKLQFKKEFALINALIAVTSFYIIAIPIEAPWDIYAHTFMLGGIYFLFQLFNENTKKWKNAILSGVLIGFSIMSKGPVSLFALFLPFVISYGIVYKFKKFKQKIIPLVFSIFLFLIIGFWWFYYVRITDANAFLAIAKKESNNWSSYNVKPFYYYWSFFIQSGIWTIPAFIGLLYPYLKNRVENLKLYQFTWLWTIIAVILLSLIPEKKSRYLMPVLIPLSLNTGLYIQYLVLNFKKLKSKKETAPVYFSFGLIALIAIAFPIIMYFVLKGNFQGVWLNYIFTSILSLIIGYFIFKNLIQKKLKSVFYLIIAFMVSVLLFGYPLSKAIPINKNYNSIEKLALKKNEHAIYSFNILSPELVWHYGDKMEEITINSSKLPLENKFYLVVQKHNISAAKKLFQTYSFKPITVYNQNISKNKERLIRHLFLVSK